MKDQRLFHLFSKEYSCRRISRRIKKRRCSLKLSSRLMISHLGRIVSLLQDSSNNKNLNKKKKMFNLNNKQNNSLKRIKKVN